MTGLRYYLTALVVDAAMAVLLYLWLIAGFEGAGNLFRVVFWTTVPLATLVLVVKGPAAITVDRPRHFRKYNVVTDIGMVGVLAWTGYPAMAVVKLLSLLVVEGVHDVRAREKAAS